MVSSNASLGHGRATICKVSTHPDFFSVVFYVHINSHHQSAHPHALIQLEDFPYYDLLHP